MTAVAFAVAFTALLVGIVWVDHTVHRLEDELDDTIDAMLDAVLDHTPNGVWVTPADDFAEWETEMKS